MIYEYDTFIHIKNQTTNCYPCRFSIKYFCCHIFLILISWFSEADLYIASTTCILDKASSPDENTGFSPLTAPIKLFSSLRYDFRRRLKALSAPTGVRSINWSSTLLKTLKGFKEAVPFVP